jgi:ABC-type multidrug transport system fused ATPase/permease subunit
LLKRAVQRQLEINDFHRIAKGDTAEFQASRLQRCWEQEIARVRTTNQARIAKALSRGAPAPADEDLATPFFFRAILHAFAKEYTLISLLALIESGSKLAAVVMLRQLVAYVNDYGAVNPEFEEWEGYVYAVGMALCTLSTMVSHHQYFFLSCRDGFRAKVACTALLFNHAQGYSAAEQAQFSSGTATNVMANDPFRFEESGPFIAFLVVAPIEAAVGLWLIYREIGTSMFVGVGVILLVLALQFYSSSAFGRIRADIVRWTDERVKAVNQVLVGYELVKMYGWEWPLLKHITEIRGKEMQGMQRNVRLKGINMGTYFAAFSAISVLTWVVHVQRGLPLEPAAVFSTIAYYSAFSFPITQFIPFAVERIAEILVACGRMQGLLLLGVDYKGTHTDTTTPTPAAAAAAPTSAAASPSQSPTHAFAADVDADVDASDAPGKAPPSSSAAAAASVSGDAVELSSLSLLEAHKHSSAHTPASASASTTAPPALRPSSSNSNDATLPSAPAPVPRGAVRVPGLDFRWPAAVEDSHPHTNARDAQADDDVIKNADEDAVTALDEDIEAALSSAAAEALLGAEDIEGPALSAIPSPSPSRARPSTHASSAAAHGLHGIRLDIKPGSLVAVVGGVGAYKTSLLHALLGEMPATGPAADGDADADADTQSKTSRFLGGAVAYAAQRPWLMQGSVRDNILFGSPLDLDRYAQTLHACALGRDVSIMAQYDKTTVADRASNLSGGQRARVALARAVYARADVVLLDDVLSAVDQTVAAHIFTHALGKRGMLRDVTRVLVTHNEALLPHVDRVVVMRDGRVAAQGSYDELRDQGLFADGPAAQQDGAQADAIALSPASDIASDVTDPAIPAPALAPAASDSNAPAAPAALTVADIRALVTRPPPPAATLIAEEARHSGSIPFAIYRAFLVADRPAYVLLLILITVAPAVLRIASDQWLADWAARPFALQSDNYVRDVFIYLCVFTIAFALVRAVAMMAHILYAANQAQQRMTVGVMFAPAAFFQSQPSGRIQNRFSRDDMMLCNFLPTIFFDFIQVTITVLSTAVVIGMVVPWVLIAVAAIVPLFYFLRQRYIPSSRDVKRLEATTRSPLLSLFSASLTGLPVLRAFRKQTQIRRLFAQLLDLNSRCYLESQYTARWLGFRLDALCVVLTIATGLFCAALRGSMDASDVGFVLVYVTNSATLFQWMTRQSAEVENLLTSAERVVEYGKIEPEGVLRGDEPLPECEAHRRQHQTQDKAAGAGNAAGSDDYDCIVYRPRPPVDGVECDSLWVQPQPQPQPGADTAVETLPHCGGAVSVDGALRPLREQADITALLALKLDDAVSRADALTALLAALQTQDTAERRLERARHAAGLTDEQRAELAAEIVEVDVSAELPHAEGLSTEAKIARVEELLLQVQLPCVHAPAHPALAADGSEVLKKAVYAPPPAWPQHGAMRIDNVVMAYRPGLPVVLRGLCIDIPAGSRVGVCGRTGAGKSSLFNVLFRLVQPYWGRVLIDGVDTAHVGLHDLRSAVAIIPQQPIIFAGSVRYNLDPFGRHSDAEMVAALEQVHLGPLLRRLPKGLGTKLSEAGGNLSVGEAQLLCIARALLMPSKILLLDECTANCDRHTDALIQQVIRDCFPGRTTLTIAHRLDTILHSDAIVVLDQGTVVEQGPPQELLKRDGAFASMYYAQQHS